MKTPSPTRFALSLLGLVLAAILVPAESWAAPLFFHTTTPCRVYRSTTDPAGALQLTIPRAIQVTGLCGVPAGARAVVLNVTETQATTSGWLYVYAPPLPNPAPGGLPFRVFPPSRAKYDIVTLSATGSVTALACASDPVTPATPCGGSGSVHVLLDVYGYFLESQNQPAVVGGGPFSLAENSANGTVVGTATATDPDAGQTHTFSITAGNTGGAFAIDASTGQITVANSAALDFETTPTFNLTVQATDNGTPPVSGSGTVVVNLTDVNEAPVPSGGPFTIAESSANGAAVGTVAHGDPDAGQTHTFSITAGNTGGVFAIDASTGAITVANSALLDAETTPSYSLTVDVTDSGTPALSGSATVVVNVTDTNEPPVPSGGPFSLAENSANGTVVGTVTVADPDAGQTHTFAITAGNTGGAFAINATSGQITVATSAALDFETTPTFNLTVQATDNGTPVLSGSTTVVVNLTNVNEAPAPTGGPFSVAENSANGTVVGTVAHNDPDAGQAHTFAITAGNTGGAFAINASTGQITVANSAALDFDTTPSFNLTVEATDNGTPALTGSTTVVVNLSNVNEAPAPTGGPFSLAENSANGTAVGTVAAGDSDAGQTHTFAITAGNTGGAFAINASTGQITVAASAALNFETTPTFNLTVEVTDNGTPALTGSTTVVVNLTDVNEPPAPTGGPFSVAENSANGTVVGTVAHNDPDAGQTRTFAITAGNTGGAFAINPASGQITVATSAALDFETTPTFNLTVEVTDNGTPALSGSATVVVNLTNVNEPPAPTGGPFSLAENSANGTSVGTVTVADSDVGQTHTFAITAGNTGGAFAINASSGQITVAASAALNFETTPTFNLTVEATDNGTPALSGSTTVVVNLTDVNEPPAPTGGPFSVPENSANGTVVGTVAHNDPDAGQTRTFAITAGNTGGAFAINAGTGQITVAASAALNFETTPTFNLTVEVTDNGTPALTGSATVVVNLTNVNEPPTDLAIDNASINENQPIGTAIGNFSTVDPDAGDTFVYALVAGTGSTDNGSFTIVGNQLRSAVIFDFEAKSSYSIRVRTTDAGGTGFSFEKVFTITIIDVPEPPVPDNDAFDFIGNTELQVDPQVESTTPHTVELTLGPPTLGVLDGDTDPEGGALTVSRIIGCADLTSPYTCATANGGTVVMEDTGRFSFTPKAGDTAATDSFQYEAKDPSNLTATGNVTLTRFERVWYVDPTAGAGGNGTSSSPYNSLTPLNGAGGAGDADLTSDYIFIHDGTLAGAIELEAGQHLVGEGTALSLPVNLNGNGSPTNLVAAGTRPQLTNASGDTVKITQAIPVEIVGLSLASTTGNAIDLTSAAALTGSAALAIGNNQFRGAGAEGIDVNLNAGTTGTLALNVTGNTWAAGTHTGNAVDVNRAAGTLRIDFSNNTTITSAATAVNINGGAAASTTVTGLANNTVHQNTGGGGILVSNATFDANVAAANLQAVSGGTTLIGISGDPVGGAGLVLSTVTGALDFTDLDVFAGGGAGVSVSGAGAFTGAAGTRLTVAADVGIVESTGGPAVDAANATVDLRLTTIKVNSSPTTGVSLVNVSDASVAPLAAQFSAGTGSSIANVTGTDFNVDGGNATISYAGSITNSAGRSVSVANRTGDSVTFTSNSTINDTGTGIQVSSNAAGTVTDFLGTLTLSTGGNAAFAASSGGTLRVMGAANTIATTTGVALNVTNTTIGAGSGAPETGLRFRSIAAGTGASGPTNGIVLNNTGASGSLTVTGNGGGNSGGTIRRTTGDGILLTNTLSPSFTNVQISNTGGSGVNGTQVTNFSFVNGTIDTTGTAAGQSNIAFNSAAVGTESNVSGTVTITGNTLTNAFYHGVDIQNFNGTLANANISNNTITSSTSAAASNGSGIRLIANGSATTVSVVTQATISNNIISNFPSGSAIRVQGGNANAAGPAGTLGVAGNGGSVISITGNRVAGASAAIKMGLEGILATVSGKGQGNFTITGNGTAANPIAFVTGTAISVNALGAATVTSTVSNNFIAPNNTFAGNGVAAGVNSIFGITDAPDLTVTITNNNISAVDGNGILAVARNSNGTMRAKIQNNTVAAPLTGVRPGIRVDSGTASGNTTVCLNISGNTSAGSGGSQGLGLRKQGTVPATNTFGVNGMAATSSPGVEAYVDGLNPAGSGTLLISATSGFTNCSLP